MSAELTEKAVSEGGLFRVFVDGQARYPSFFADRRFDQQSLKAVCRKLGDLPGRSKWQFFITRKASLGGITPLVALQQGMRKRVLIAAEGFAQR